MVNKNIRLCLILIWIIAAVSVGAQDFEAAELPNTPAANQFKKFLDALKSGEHGAYIKNNFSEQFLNDFSMEEHLSFFQQVSMMHGGFKVHTIEKSSEDELIVIAKSQKRDAWRRIHLQTKPDPPHKLTLFGMDMADSPIESEAPPKKMTEREILDFVERELNTMSKEDRFSGAILIARNGEPLFKNAYGMASKRYNVPNNVNTKFNIGSINKSFTELAIAQLLEDGKINLQDKISTYLPDFPKDIAEKVTIEHLITMKSGMGHYWNDRYWANYTKIRTVDDLMAIIKDEPLDFEPGTKRRYSNSGFIVLGAIIEEVTGQSYYDYVRENIYEPAGMTNTACYEMDQIVPNLAIGYTVNRSKSPYNDNKLQNNLFLHAIKGSPAGGGYSTLDDLFSYAKALKANKLAGRNYTNLVLDLYQNINNPDRRPNEFIIAGGAPVGINALVADDFESGYTVIVLSNYDPPTAEVFGEKVFEMLRNQAPN